VDHRADRELKPERDAIVCDAGEHAREGQGEPLVHVTEEFRLQPRGDFGRIRVEPRQHVAREGSRTLPAHRVELLDRRPEQTRRDGLQGQRRGRGLERVELREPAPVQRIHPARQCRAQQLFLGAEVVVGGRHAEARGLRHRAHRCALEAAFGEEPLRGMEQAFLGISRGVGLGSGRRAAQRVVLRVERSRRARGGKAGR
jgi:hypothetical protein